jgi:glycerol-3-phosphate dehydrogenase (NAD(P)+)
MANVAVLGAGTFGTALAVILARRGNQVALCARRRDLVEQMIAARENRAYLPSIGFPPSLDVTNDWRAAITKGDFVMMVVPSPFVRTAIGPILPEMAPGVTLISLAKGIEQDSLLTMSQMLGRLAPHIQKIAVVSGPSFALEVAQEKPAALVCAAADQAVALSVQQLLAGPRLRMYRSSDVIGVELGGAAKNVIAIAAGIADGLNLGASARAALITRGVAEMMRLALAAGGRSETIAGLAGLGDLVLTCTGDLSRNRRLGLAIARGEPPPIPGPGKPVAEGMTNSASIRMLANRLAVEMPIVDAVYRVLYEGLGPTAIVDELLSRVLKAEFH